MSVRVYMCVSVRVYAPTCACVCVALYTVLSGGGGVFSLSKRLHTFVYRQDNDVYFNFQLIQHILLIR